ncbi:MAG TPA: hypothetical protein P5186_19120 [Candidatus Paceibacterota bacterium]|nr:hypothetical protein [Candidatus Paceibacterota bacterium]
MKPNEILPEPLNRLCQGLTRSAASIPAGEWHSAQNVAALLVHNAILISKQGALVSHNTVK